ncbi:hypothetical protein GCM10027445_25860 [Amycolatopsis endophytica]|uniref:Uncharacterized protein n=1 Tax=Amycolatopsis endophytica TaxID=860233 RepID=A0A853BC40_9PSEU|nr:hypothetical protein [Amycolatopsis endophytica]
MSHNRIALVVPGSNATVETELPALLARHPAAEFSFHAGRMRSSGRCAPFRPGGRTPHACGRREEAGMNRSCPWWCRACRTGVVAHYDRRP